MRIRLPEMLLLFGMCLVLALPACLSPESGDQDKVPVSPSSMFFEKPHNFCSDVIEDRILVGYFGEDLLDTEVFFYVICHKGDTVFKDNWPSSAYFEGTERSFPNDSAKVEFVQGRMRDMVIGIENMPEVTVSDSMAQAMELGPQFSYRVGSALKRTIAYSRTGKKVIVL